VVHLPKMGDEFGQDGSEVGQKRSVGYQNRWFLRGHIINELTSGGTSEYGFLFVLLAYEGIC
jgi:hypothetical protein